MGSNDVAGTTGIGLEGAMALFGKAMERMLAIHPDLAEALDDAPATGRLPSRDAMLELANPAAWTWDGTVDGVPLWDAGQVAWCTLRDRYGWGLPCAESLDAIGTACGAGGRLLEVGAGTGYWAAVLRARGIDVLAVDTGTTGGWSHRWGGVTTMRSEDAVAANPGIPVPIPWPDPALGDGVLAAMRPGTTLPRAGPRWVTGGQRFKDRLDEAMDPVSTAPGLDASGGADDIETRVTADRPWGRAPRSTGRWAPIVPRRT